MEANILKDILNKDIWTLSELEPGEPYEYVIKGTGSISDEAFDELVSMMDDLNDDGVCTLTFEGYNYWVMGSKDETSILYRQKDFSEFDSLDTPFEEHYDHQMLSEVAKMIGERYPERDIFEAACGTGSLAKELSIPCQKYRGVDPSQKAIDIFIERLPQYQDRVFCKSLEQTYSLWQNSNEVIIATFGAPNYFMRQYLKILTDSRKDLFLMFYKEDYLPKEFSSLHNAVYSEDELKSIFPHCKVESYHDYLIVSTR